MKKQGRVLLWRGLCLLASFLLWTALLQVMDVQPIGPMGTEVGFAAVNGWFHRLTGVHMALYTITDWLGLVPIGVCLLFGAVGLVQLVTRRSLRKVDADILLLGVYYVLVILGYLLFEMFPFNYRPVLIDGRLEASYPSSTTLLVVSVMPTLLWQVDRRLKNAGVKRVIFVLTTGFSVLMVLGRLLSGVHWLSDIVGAILLSAGLFCIYEAVVVSYEKED